MVDKARLINVTLTVAYDVLYTDGSLTAYEQNNYLTI